MNSKSDLKYSIKWNRDGSFTVWNNSYKIKEFTGSIQECESWLRLNDAGYIY